MNDLPQDTNPSFKLAVCVNKTVESGKAKNALAHVVAGLVARVGEDGREALKFIDFIDSDGVIYPSISARSFIVLRGSQGDLRKAIRQAKEANVVAVVFTETMTGETYREQLDRTAATKTDEMPIWAVAMAGPAEVINPITKRMSLWREHPSTEPTLTAEKGGD